jgi:hypothetical protein
VSKYRRGDSAPVEVPPDSPEGRDLGLSDHLLPGGQPHISNRAVRQQEAPDAPPRPEYRGAMAHGVPVPQDLNAPQEQQPASEMHWERATAGLATFARIPPPDPTEQLTPIAVRIVTAGGTKSKSVSSYLHYKVPVMGSAPVRLAGRDPRRTRLLLYNESLPAAGGQSAGTVGSKVNPGAAGDITGVDQVLAAGTYLVQWSVSPGAGAAHANNFELLNGATVVAPSLNPVAAGQYAQLPVTVIVPAGGATVGISAIAADGATTYGATMITTLQPAPAIGCRIATFPGDLAQDLATGFSLSGAMLPPGGTSYQAFNTQSEVFACSEGTQQTTISVVQEYEVSLEP